MKKCPFCAENIQDKAIKCKHCGEWLNKKKYSKENTHDENFIELVSTQKKINEDNTQSKSSIKKEILKIPKIALIKKYRTYLLIGFFLEHTLFLKNMSIFTNNIGFIYFCVLLFLIGFILIVISTIKLGKILELSEYRMYYVTVCNPTFLFGVLSLSYMLIVTNKKIKRDSINEPNYIKRRISLTPFLEAFVMYGAYVTIMLHKEKIVYPSLNAEIFSDLLEIGGIVPLLLIYSVLWKRIFKINWINKHQWIGLASVIAGFISLFLMVSIIVFIQYSFFE